MTPPAKNKRKRPASKSGPGKYAAVVKRSLKRRPTPRTPAYSAIPGGSATKPRSALPRREMPRDSSGYVMAPGAELREKGLTNFNARKIMRRSE